jgi:hypothetical protein
MSLTRTIDQMVAAVRKTTNALGTSALQRHPEVDLFDYVNRGIAALDRKLKLVDTGQRYLSSSTITTVDGTEIYALPSDFMHMVSLSGEINSVMRWFQSYDLSERPGLVDTNAGWTGEPLYYRLRQGNISLLPTPADVYTLTLWYAPAPSTLVTTETYDTIARLDDYIVWHAAREVCKKDKNWELHDRLTADMAAMASEIEVIGRNRDMNSPSRIVDCSRRDRYGRSRYR